MIRVGLSGNRFSGKNKVAKVFFDSFDIPIFDADIVLKFILNHAALSDLSMNSTILERIGVDYISDDYSMIKLNKVNEDKKFLDLLKIVEKDLFKAYNRFIKNKKALGTLFLILVFYLRPVGTKEWTET